MLGMKIPSVTQQQSKGALMILSMAGNSDTEIIKNKINTLVSVGLGERWKQDEDIARYSCIALQKLNHVDKNDKGRKDPPARFPANHQLFQKLASILLEPSNNPSKWFPAGEQAVNTIYLLAEQPDSIITPVIKKLASRLFNQSPNSSPSESSNISNIDLSKFLFVIGHVALKHMQYLEDIQNELTRRKNLNEDTRMSFFPLPSFLPCSLPSLLLPPSSSVPPSFLSSFFLPSFLPPSSFLSFTIFNSMLYFYYPFIASSFLMKI